MPIFILRAVRRSADGTKSAHVAGSWPYEAASLAEAKRFVDQTPRIGWANADAFEITDRDGRPLARRAMSHDADIDPSEWTSLDLPPDEASQASPDA